MEPLTTPRGESDDSGGEMYGPALPPELAASRTKPATPRCVDGQARRRTPVGPFVPDNLAALIDNAKQGSGSQEQPTPSYPAEESDDGATIGPTLPQTDSAESDPRALQRCRGASPEVSIAPPKPQRESWMTVPPTSQVPTDPLQIRNRQFNRQTPAELAFDPAWTQVPSESNARTETQAKRDRLKRPSQRTDEGPAKLSKKDQEAQEAVSAYNKKYRSKSLLEEHLERIDREKRHKRRSKRASASTSHRSSTHRDDEERRPFDRDRDLAVGKVDLKHQRKFLNDAGYLDSKYSHGKHGAFL
ncbi:hypothetical protein H4R34_000136 [Dimargaris verticillata]|uniref:DUF3752 domain-containing protein n=1 Tax=Dimargaris verticillata TaxID=2761393 RepID=A0A9W8B8M3_9FUNG|nr:hypothetical protein H4R34_000136 [Dimargaris verticillata]